MFDKGLYPLLVASSSLASVGVGTNIYFSQLPKGAGFPALILHKVSTVPIITLGGTADLVAQRWQVDCISSVDQMNARAVAQAVKKLLTDFAGTLTDGTIVQTTTLENEIDMAFEVGALGYAFRVAVDFIFEVKEP